MTHNNTVTRKLSDCKIVCWEDKKAAFAFISYTFLNSKEERINYWHLKLRHLIFKRISSKLILLNVWITIIPTDDVICKTHLHGLSPPTGDVAVLQLLWPPSSLSFIFLRSGVGMYPLWLLLLGRYWLKGRGVRSSVTEVRRTDMSSLRTSGIFLWGGPSDSESLPRPVGDARNIAIIKIQLLRIYTVLGEERHIHTLIMCLYITQTFNRRFNRSIKVILQCFSSWCIPVVDDITYILGADLMLPHGLEGFT